VLLLAHCLDRCQSGVVQIDAEYEASLELHDCPLLPVVRGQWVGEAHIFQVQEDAGMSLEDLTRQQGWGQMAFHDKVEVAQQVTADVLLGIMCNVNRVSA